MSATMLLFKQYRVRELVASQSEFHTLGSDHSPPLQHILTLTVSSLASEARPWVLECASHDLSHLLMYQVLDSYHLVSAYLRTNLL